MVMFSVEEANGQSRHRDADDCQHDEVEDGHGTLPGNLTANRDPPVFPNLLSYTKNSLLSVMYEPPKVTRSAWESASILVLVVTSPLPDKPGP
jgi:hypothetical protein